jgi:hypothetical protein
MLRLLPMSDRDKDAEILALRHQITVPERQPGKGYSASILRGVSQNPRETEPSHRPARRAHMSAATPAGEAPSPTPATAQPAPVRLTRTGSARAVAPAANT